MLAPVGQANGYLWRHSDPFCCDGLGTVTQNWFLITYEFGLVVEWCDRAEPKPVPMPLCSPQIPHIQPWEWTAVSGLIDRPLLAWAVLCGHMTSAESADHRLITPICLCTAPNTGKPLLQHGLPLSSNLVMDFQGNKLRTFGILYSKIISSTHTFILLISIQTWKYPIFSAS
jgi:hypothetical protein